MKMAFVTPLVFALLSFCLSCSPRHLVNVQQPPAQEKQVDVITRDGKTVDVREAARNLHNCNMYREAWQILLLSKNASLSASTVNLLKSVLANHSWNGALNDDSAEMRRRAVHLLGLSRNPDAIDIVVDHMVNDPAWRVRGRAGDALGRLKGEEALSALLAAAEKNKISKRNAGFYHVGDKAVPLVIQWMEKDFAKYGGNNLAHTYASSLGWIGDRRAIEPLLRIIAHPADPTIDLVRREAAQALARFTFEESYLDNLEFRTAYLAIPPPTSRKSWSVNAKDRKRIIKALQKAGYGIHLLGVVYDLPKD